MNKKIKIPLDVLAYWYDAASRAEARYRNMIEGKEECFPPNTERKREIQRSYTMAVKTIEALRDVFATVEIENTEREVENNE